MTRPTARTTAPRLPRSARARLERAENATVRTSFLSVPAAYGVGAAGFEPVGDVMGCIAFATAVEYLGRCGSGGRYAVAAAPVTFVASGGGTSTSYLRQLGGAYRTALERLRAEARALQADGIIGVALELAHHDTVREVVATGTAVRSTGRLHSSRPFTTDLSGADLTALLAGGWAPVDLQVAVQLALRHDDLQTLAEASPLRSSGNREVSGYTELRQRITQRVRDDLRAGFARSGADGGLLSRLHVQTWHRHCMASGNGSDLVGLATATGTSLVRFARGTHRPASPLTILPLTRSTR